MTEPPVGEPAARTNGLPSSWTQARIDEVGRVQMGRQRSPDFQSGRFTKPYLRAANILDGKIDMSDVLSMDFDPRDFATFSLQAGDVLVVEGGSVGRSAVYHDNLPGACFQNTVIRFQPNEQVTFPEFADLLFRWYFHRGLFKNVSKQTTIAHLGLTRFAAMPYVLPPLPEQRRIVEAIETRFARLDAAVRALERARANLKRYRASTLASVFPEENQGSTAHFVDLSTICDTATGGTPRRNNPAFYDGSVPWIKSGELHDGLVTGSEEAITQEALNNSNAKVFPAGTVCMALYGATVGKLGILGLDAATNQAVCAFFPHRELSSKYLFWFLRSVRDRLLRNRSGGAQPNISQTIVRRLRAPIPSVDQQCALVAEIERRLSVIEEASVESERAFRRCGRLRESILEAAFQGRLAPQDPNDEPANSLLERVKREGSLASQSMTRKRKTARAS